MVGVTREEVVVRRVMAVVGVGGLEMGEREEKGGLGLSGDWKRALAAGDLFLDLSMDPNLTGLEGGGGLGND